MRNFLICAAFIAALGMFTSVNGQNLKIKRSNNTEQCQKKFDSAKLNCKKTVCTVANQTKCEKACKTECLEACKKECMEACQTKCPVECQEGKNCTADCKQACEQTQCTRQLKRCCETSAQAAKK